MRVGKPFGVTGEGVRKWREQLMKAIPDEVLLAELSAVNLHRTYAKLKGPASEQVLLSSIDLDGKTYQIARGLEMSEKK